MTIDHRGQIRVIFESNMSGVEEFSDTFYKLLKVSQWRVYSDSLTPLCQLKADRNSVCRRYIKEAMRVLGNDSGFDEFERTLVSGCGNHTRPFTALVP